MDWLINLLGGFVILFIIAWFWLLKPGSKK